MLRPPHTTYSRLYIYHLDRRDLPEISDPDLIGAWTEEETTILFFHRPRERLVESLCRAHGAQILYQADIDYRDWEAGCEIGPFSVGKLTVAPVWEKCPADIVLDPSVIFGSGFHPSTRLCLEALLKYTDTPGISLDTAMDLGCGTGLLAIAAAGQGVARVTACDNNRLACQVARDNAVRNRVQDRITVLEADLRHQCPNTAGVDLVMANLYKGLMAKLFENPSFWQGKLYLLSGFIPAMEEELLAALPDKGLRFLERSRNERWCLWILTTL